MVGETVPKERPAGEYHASMDGSPREAGTRPASRPQAVIALFASAAIALHLLLRFAVKATTPVFNLAAYDWPLVVALVLGGTPLVLELVLKLWRRQFGSDLLAGLSIVTSVLLGEYLAGTLVVLMLSGGEALEAYAVRSASSVLKALAKRMPSMAHRKLDGNVADIALDQVAIGDTLTLRIGAADFVLRILQHETETPLPQD
jgi:cation transport ATPase